MPAVINPRSNPSAKTQLFCFPYAGGNASLMQNIVGSTSPEFDLWFVEYSGRGRRMREPLLSSMEAMVADLLPSITSAIDRPFAFFGHSLGSLVAFEILKTLPHPSSSSRALLISASRSPFSASRSPSDEFDRPHFHDLPTPDLVEEIRKLGGLPEELLSDPQVIDFTLPVLRADLKVREFYVCETVAPLDIPIIAYGADQDPDVTATDISRWQAHTTKEFSFRRFSGGHFYLIDSPGEFRQCLFHDLHSLS